jgi:predicted GIY-YIG superfamily endonuclease
MKTKRNDYSEEYIQSLTEWTAIKKTKKKAINREKELKKVIKKQTIKNRLR